jgi:hypothetical protein
MLGCFALNPIKATKGEFHNVMSWMADYIWDMSILNVEIA